jgi:alpha-beta hydrolase superfamily lysophospholipase
LFARGWEPDGPLKGAAVLVHGLGEHSGRYAHVGAAFTDAGYALAAFDQRGHGRTAGPRGYAPSFKALMQDIGACFDFARARYPANQTWFQYGHSLGGLLTLAYHLYARPDVAGVLVTSPGLATALAEQKAKVLLVRVLNSILPKMILSTGLDVHTLSRDTRVVEAYVKDPLVHDKTSLSFGKAGLEAIDYCFRHAPEFKAPLLIMHGTGDRLTYPRGGQEFIRRAASTDAVFKPWEGLYHELHNEPEQRQVLRTLIDWMDAHADGG